MSDNKIRYIDIKEFREIGFLQEANRLFFHPLGLALEITIVDPQGDTELRKRLAKALEDFDITSATDIDALLDHLTERLSPPGSEYISNVWDYRDDPEGMIFAWPEWPNPEAASKAATQKQIRVAQERNRHREAREKLFREMYPQYIMSNPIIEPILWAEKQDGEDRN